MMKKMRKLTLLLAALLLFTVLTPISGLADDEYLTVIFRSADEHIRFDDNRGGAAYSVKAGDKVTHPNVYSTLRGSGDFEYRLKSTGETVDLNEFTVTEDEIIIEVDFQDPPEAIHTVTYICSEYPGIDMYHHIYDVADYGGHMITITCADGYVLTDDDVPLKRPILGSNTQNLYLVWDTDPVGYEVHNDVIFIADVKDTGLYDVSFWDYSHHELGGYAQVPRGSSVEPPQDVPDWHEYIFVGWSSDEYLNVQNNLNIFARYALRGDANMNDELDVGDATLILRAVVKLDEPGLNYDYNKNGRLDSGDAAGILIACVDK